MSVAVSRKFPLIVFGLLTLINVAVFLRRDSADDQPRRTEAQLYQAPGTEWNRYFNDFTGAGQQQAIRFTDSLLRGSDSSRLNQIRLIGSYLYRQFAPQLGKPLFQENYKDPWEMFRYYQADSSRKLWCGHLSMLFTYFCLSQGIETRMIELMKNGDHHVVNECYLPATGKWVLVDLTYDQLFVSQDDQLLGLTAFRRMQGRGDVLLHVQSAGDSNRSISMDTGYIKNYYGAAVPVYYYLTVNPAVVYSTTAKIKRYLWSDPWYYILSERPAASLPFYLRQGLLLAWLLSIGWVLFHWRKQRK